MTANLLEVNKVKTYFFTRAGVVKAVDNVSFTMKPGETLGVVDESGSGKSVSALSVIRLIADPPGKIIGLPVISMRNRPTYQIIMKKQMAAHKQSKMVSRLDKLVEHARHALDDQRTINSSSLAFVSRLTTSRLTHELARACASAVWLLILSYLLQWLKSCENDGQTH